MSGSEDGGFTPPSWFRKAAALFTAGGATVAGVSLWEDPASWAILTVSSFVVDLLTGIAESVGSLIVLVNSQITGAFGTVGATILSGLGVVGQALLLPFQIVEGVVSTLAGAAGPFSFVILVLSWVVAGLIGALLVRLGVRALVVIT